MATCIGQHGNSLTVLAILLGLSFARVAWSQDSTGGRGGQVSVTSKLRGKHTSMTSGVAVHDLSSTVADSKSSHNYENAPREACDFDKHGEGLVHVAVARESWQPYNENPDEITRLQQQWRGFVEGLPEYKDVAASKAVGRGIVYAAGSESFNQLLVSIRMLRMLGCKLPIEVWHFEGELNEYQLALLAQMGVAVRDVGAEGNHIRLELNTSMAKPYDIKPTALINSAFEEALFLDADNVPVVDPTYLFDSPEFKTTGTIMFPDFWSTDARNPIYKIMDVPCWREREVESGQLLVSKRVAWKALNLAWFLNRNHYHYYALVFGDKDTFRFAWKALGQAYHLIRHLPAEVGFMTKEEGQFCGHTLGHHDPSGNIAFLHTHLLKWHEWKGRYPWTHFRDRWNGFNIARPWTHTQELKIDVLDMERYKPNWLTAQPELRCLQYIHVTPDNRDKTVRLEEGDPNKPKQIAEARPLADVFDSKSFYVKFDRAEGPLLLVATY